MKSLVLQSPGHLTVVDQPEPVSGPGEVLVRVVACGVCGTDIHALSGKQPFFSYPRRLGHELCVEVLEPTPDSSLKKGDLCAVEPYFSCGDCPACRSGKTNCCSALRVLGVHIDGGHQPRMVLPVKSLHPSSKLSPDQLALVEPLVIGAHAVERAAPGASEPLVVIGMGPIGLAVALFAKAKSANVVLVDVDPDRLNFAADTMQLGRSMVAGETLDKELRDYFGQLPTCIIDATGNPLSMNYCFELAEHGGRVVFVGLFIGDLQFDDPNFHRRELSLFASRAGTSSTFKTVIEMMESGVIDPLPLITHRLSFESLVEDLPSLHLKPGLVKAMIDFP